MSMLNTAFNKQPFKLIEVPLNKFHEEAVPHHQQAYEVYKNTIQKLIAINNIEQLNREIRDKKRVVQQLRALMYELDTLRTQVEDSDLDKFDSRTLSLRKKMLTLVTGYSEMEKTVSKINEQFKEQEEVQNPMQHVSQIQTQKSLKDIKLQERLNQLQQVEELNKDIQDLNGIYTELNQMVHEQKQAIDGIESNVESTHENVSQGWKHIVTAAALKKATYPITGALIGTIAGGPVGLVAGFKIGGLAAIGCGIIGYTGGKFIKKMQNTYAIEDTDLTASSPENNTGNNNIVQPTTDKKDK